MKINHGRGIDIPTTVAHVWLFMFLLSLHALVLKLPYFWAFTGLRRMGLLPLGLENLVLGVEMLLSKHLLVVFLHLRGGFVLQGHLLVVAAALGGRTVGEELSEGLEYFGDPG